MAMSLLHALDARGSIDSGFELAAEATNEEHGWSGRIAWRLLIRK